jgi:hypothetical protein
LKSDDLTYQSCPKKRNFTAICQRSKHKIQNIWVNVIFSSVLLLCHAYSHTNLRQVLTNRIPAPNWRAFIMQKAIGTKQRPKKPSSTISSTSNSYSEVNSKVLEVMFVYDDSEDSVEVVESTVIDFYAVIEHLRQGHAVFIAPKTYGKNQSSKEQTKGKDYFAHV